MIDVQSLPKTTPSQEGWPGLRNKLIALVRDHARLVKERRAIKEELRAEKDGTQALLERIAGLEKERDCALHEFRAWREFQAGLSAMSRAELLMQQAADSCDRLLAAYETAGESRWTVEARTEAERSSRKLRQVCAQMFLAKDAAIDVATKPNRREGH